ncbi:MAG TPA: O-antigen ligase family protein [Terriglobia bacterium]|nr:O-antigen ligase family protein [Terriglobia bacterium]
MELPETPSHAPSPLFFVTRWGMLANLLAAPLAFGAVDPWAWAALLIASFGLLLLWTIGCLRQGVLKINVSPLYLTAILFLALPLVQFYGGITLDAYATRESIFKLVIVLIIFFIAGQVFSVAPKYAWRQLGLAVTLYTFALGLFAILQFFSSNNLIYWSVKSDGWTFGPYVNHNDYAGLMEMLVPVSAAHVLSRPHTDPRRLLLALSLAVPAASALLSGSRGGFVCLLVEALVLGWVLWRHSSNGERTYGAMLPIGLAAAALLFFWIAPNTVVRRLGGLSNLTQTTRITLGQRELAARDSLRIFRDHLWLGTGLGSFESVFPQYRTFPTDFEWAHAHNDYAEALAETGMAGAALIVYSLALFFKLAFKNFAARRRDEVGWIQLGSAIGCCGLLVHSFVDFNLHIPANAMWFAVAVALATTARRAADKKASA